ncbi:MAG: hypothetical protein K2G93_08850 [Rikenella sp.]|nr:hypothetical protein [Rikenella sp.]
MENTIGAYLDDYTRLDEPGVPAQLYDLVQLYPWFTLGRYMQIRSLRYSDPAGYRRALRRADVRLFVHPWPRLLLDETQSTEAYSDSTYADYDAGGTIAAEDGTDRGGFSRPDTVEVIDDFLEHFGGAGERITPPPPPMLGRAGAEEYVQEDISASSVAEDGEIATETLAEIYLAQGLPERAIEIYSKLSLKYPEKSVYFADLIADVRACYGGR